MGCNTSKESVPAVDGQDKEKQENGDVNKAADNNVGNSETVDEKTSSAKTITLRGSTPSSPASQEKGEKKQEEEAATKIQAAFRGHKTRKSMKQPEKSAAGEQEPTKQEMEAEFRSDDKELCQAATKIQASFRGHMSRKQLEKEEEAANKDPTSKKPNNEEEELDVDLSDPELNKAAVKIQASFRGHMVRKEAEGTATENAH